MAELFRPHMHFTPQQGWMNDPNGLVYFNGEWHLFYQYFDPLQSQGMQWGHAVSRDLLRWEHLPAAIRPDRLGHIWSGSAVVDHQDSSGLFNGRSGIVCLYTYWDPSDGRQSQGLAFSRDGRKFEKFQSNPVIPQLRNLPGQPDDKDFRDPKVFWHKPSTRWIMVVAGGKLRIFSSMDFISWRFESVAEDIATECPDLFELPVDDKPGQTRWVLSGGGRWYMLGNFDGSRFIPESDRLPMTVGPDCYATQTWSDTPDGRRIAVAWLFSWSYKCGARPGRIENTFPTTPWAGGCLTLPYELSLRSSSNGVRLCQRPVREYDAELRPTATDLNIMSEINGTASLGNILKSALDMRLEINAKGGSEASLTIPSANRGHYSLIFKPLEKLLIFDRSRSGAAGIQNYLEQYGIPLPSGADGLATIRIIIDKCSIEIFADEGLVHFSAVILPDESGDISLMVRNCSCRIKLSSSRISEAG